MDADHIGSLCPVCIKIPSPGRKAGVRYKLYCLQSLLPVSHCHLFGKWRNPLETQVSGCRPRATSQGVPSKNRSWVLYVDTFLYICLLSGKGGLPSQMDSGGQTQDYCDLWIIRDAQQAYLGAWNSGEKYVWRCRCGSCWPIVTLKAKFM